MGGREKQRPAVTTYLTEQSLVWEEKQGRSLLALQVAAISGYVEFVQPTQTLCLSLCNTCRDNVPAKCVRISYRVPPTILAIAYPLVQKAETGDSSRVVPHRKAMKVHWTFSDDSLNDRDVVANETQEETGDTDLATCGNVDMDKVRWPQGVREVALLSFNRRLDTVTWPPDLDTLWFGQPTVSCVPDNNRRPDIFDMPLDGVMLPANLLEIYFGDKFNQPIEGIAWPGALERLSLPGFNKPIQDVQWPPGLKSLEFVSPSKIRLWKDGGTNRDFMKDEGIDPDIWNPFSKDSPRGQGLFNQPLRSTLPATLECLWLSRAFEQSLENVAWPSGIVTLGVTFDLRIDPVMWTVTWPSGLQELCLYNKPFYWGTMYPTGSKVTILETWYPPHDEADDFDCPYCSDEECGEGGYYCFVLA